LENGVCSAASDTVMIIVHDLTIPTLITPNMDGKNDFFVLRGLENLGKTELEIFNRGGVKVWKNEEYDNLWNGVDNYGHPLPDDTYFYVLRTVRGKSLSGYLVIRR
jgi:gliding motility-associated-like protein